MKKIFSVILATVMMLATLASCTTPGGPSDETSGVNTTVTLKFMVGTESVYEGTVTVNGDTPVVIDAVRAAAEDASVGIAVSELGDKVLAVGTYKDCELSVGDATVMYYWTFQVNGRASQRPQEREISEDDVIEFVFTRGALNESNVFEEAPYDPTTNEYREPAEESA